MKRPHADAVVKGAIRTATRHIIAHTLRRLIRITDQTFGGATCVILFRRQCTFQALCIGPIAAEFSAALMEEAEVAETATAMTTAEAKADSL